MITAVVTSVLLLVLLPAAAHRWELKRRHFLPWSVAMAVAAFAMTYGGSLLAPSVPAFLFGATAVAISGALSVAMIMFCFFRDPERQPPADSGVLVSPADGTVVYVKEIEDGRFPFAVKNNSRIPLSEFSEVDLIPDRGIQIGIAMNFLNVHVNRSPIDGKVRWLKPIHGAFVSLKHLHALLENERNLMVFENDNLKVGVVQVASRLVRRIVPFVVEGQSVRQGDRVGMIKFGSQVDLLVPYRADLVVNVAVGDELVAGESVVMTCNPAPLENPSSIRGESLQTRK